jgi:hypothetical protein
MSNKIDRRFALLLVLGILLVIGVSLAKAEPGNGSGTATPDPITEVLINSMQSDGFQVSQGYAQLYSLPQCIRYTYPAFKNCFLANPAAPYVVPVLRAWPDEYIDPGEVDSILDTEPGFTTMFRLDPTEAILIYGRMPPPGRYMGLQTWVFSEHASWKTKDYNRWASIPNLAFPMQYLFETFPPNDPKSQRIISLTALGDVVNNTLMERKSGYPFGEIRYFIITPSATTEKAIRRLLQKQGVLDSHIFTEEIPSRDNYGPIGPLGMGKNAIDFFTAIRYAVPNPGYELDAREWRANPPLTVLRVRASASLGPTQRFGALVFEPRAGKGNNEISLSGDLDNLVTAVCNTLTSQLNLTTTDCTLPPPETTYIPELVHDYGWIGPYCRSIDMNCLADQQEAALYFSSPRSLGDKQVIAVIGTLATETGNATYVALSANDASMMAGVANVLDSDMFIPPDTYLKGLKGSADSFSATVDHSELFFVHYFTKDCSVFESYPVAKANCSPVKGADAEQGDPALRDMFIISVREYIAPGTHSGPDPALLLTPRLLLFTQP